MSYNGFAIDQYLDAAEVTRQLDELIKKPVWSIRRDKLADYVENYFDAKCPQSKAMISQAKRSSLAESSTIWPSTTPSPL